MKLFASGRELRAAARQTRDPELVRRALHEAGPPPPLRAVRVAAKVFQTPLLMRTAARARNCKSFILFIGYPSSGHTLFANLLNLHPDILVSNELDATVYFQYGIPARALRGAIIRHDEKFETQSRINTKGYSYDFGQNKTSEKHDIRVIGDKKGFPTARRLARNPELLRKFEDRLGCPVKVFHLVRNPSDMLGSFTKHVDDLLPAAWELEEMARLNDTIAAMLPEEQFLPVFFEDLVHNPAAVLEDASAFLDLPADCHYLECGAQAVDARVGRPPRNTPWPQETQDVLDRVLQNYSAFATYRG